MTKVNDNLKSGFKKSKNALGDDGGSLQRVASMLAHATNVEFGKNMNAVHGRKLRDVNTYARQNFEAAIRRPNESGSRQHARQTGQFTFGGSGTFKGTIINEEDVDAYGFGYPDIARADRRTDFVWRSLEFGLRPHPEAIRNEFSPRGSARFPKRFTFLPFSGQGGGALQPRASGSGPSGLLVSPRGRVIRRVSHPGIAPKLFITRAMERVGEDLNKDYQGVVAKTFKNFRR